MSRFKWHRVFVAMDATDWQWSSVGGVPELVDLKRCVRELALDLCQHSAKARQKRTISTGGFTVGAYGKGFYIQFVMTESDNEPELNLQV
jgi:hypothetical protein